MATTLPTRTLMLERIAVRSAHEAAQAIGGAERAARHAKQHELADRLASLEREAWQAYDDAIAIVLAAINEGGAR